MSRLWWKRVLLIAVGTALSLLVIALVGGKDSSSQTVPPNTNGTINANLAENPIPLDELERRGMHINLTPPPGAPDLPATSTSSPS